MMEKNESKPNAFDIKTAAPSGPKKETLPSFRQEQKEAKSILRTVSSDRKSLAKKSVPLIEKGNFCRYFSTMIRSGTPILEAVDILSSEAENKTLRAILREIKNDLQKGKTLGQSFKMYPKAFDELFLTVIIAGEESGTLDRSLEYLGKQLIADYYLVQKVKGALLYPLIIIVAMVVMAFIMFGAVLPRIATVFLSSGLPIPTVTKIVFTISLFVQKYFLFIVLAFIAATALLLYFFLKGKGRDLIRGILPRIPVVKTIFSDLDIARFGRVLGTLLQSGVPIVHALKIATSTLTLPQYASLGAKLEVEISKGASMKDVLHKKGSAFPRMMTGMIAVGEETGSLEKVLFDIADFYDQEVDASLKNFTTVLEPVLMILVGIAVALMVLSIVIPIYSLIGSFQVTK